MSPLCPYLFLMWLAFLLLKFLGPRRARLGAGGRRTPELIPSLALGFTSVNVACSPPSLAPRSSRSSSRRARLLPALARSARPPRSGRVVTLRLLLLRGRAAARAAFLAAVTAGVHGVRATAGSWVAGALVVHVPHTPRPCLEHALVELV